jgi:hypothetical protein
MAMNDNKPPSRYDPEFDQRDELWACGEGLDLPSRTADEEIAFQIWKRRVR